MPNKISKSRQIAQKTIYEAFKILKANDGEMRGKDVIDEIRKRVEFNEYEKHRYEKTGYIRWESILHFYTIDCMKAGFMRKKKGVWTLTPEGEEAINLGPEKLLDSATKLYREWDAKRKEEEEPSDTENDEFGAEKDSGQAQKARISQYEEIASNGLREFVIAKNPYEFQDLVAALLEGMGYHISEIAAKGPDGGVDIIAYTDPLGTTQPRIIVQVKHRPESNISSEDIQKLSGTLRRSTDVGIFVTSGMFSKPAVKEARTSREHIELIDFERFISLWIEYNDQLTDEQKNMLPLHPIYFLGSND